MSARCGLIVVDLETGNSPHWVRFDGVISELFDIQVIAGVRRPLALGFKSDSIATMVTLEPA